MAPYQIKDGMAFTIGRLTETEVVDIHRTGDKSRHSLKTLEERVWNSANIWRSSHGATNVWCQAAIGMNDDLQILGGLLRTEDELLP